VLSENSADRHPGATNLADLLEKMSREQRIEIGEGYHLTPIRRSDKAAYLEHFADPTIARNLIQVPFPYTEADADNWLDWRARNARSEETHFALREPGGYLIGAIGTVDNLVPGVHRAEIGYWLGASYRGRGLMVHALRSYARYGFARLGLSRLYATTFVHNRASQRALEKAGFQREGCLRGYHLKEGQLIDCAIFGLLACDLPSE